MYENVCNRLFFSRKWLCKVKDDALRCDDTFYDPPFFILTVGRGFFFFFLLFVAAFKNCEESLKSSSLFFLRSLYRQDHGIKKTMSLVSKH